MLSEKTLKALNEQIILEFYSSNLYLQMSSWCEFNALDGCAKLLKADAAEEMEQRIGNSSPFPPSSNRTQPTLSGAPPVSTVRERSAALSANRPEQRYLCGHQAIHGATVEVGVAIESRTKVVDKAGCATGGIFGWFYCAAQRVFSFSGCSS